MSVSARKNGLPSNRHDFRAQAHLVDQLGSPAGDPVGRVISIRDIDPNPNQPRQEVGDLAELTASVREKGILEPILVRPRQSRFQIIAGERRYRAAIEAGLAEIPCIVREATDAEVMELALIENLQRRDLNAFEEADGLRALAEHYGYTHEAIAEKIGRSRSAITETLSITAMPAEVRDLCRLADIQGKSVLLQIVRQGSPEKMVELLQRLQEGGPATREQARRIAKDTEKPTRGRPKNYVFQWQPREKSFRLALQFRRHEVPRTEVIAALRAALAELEEAAE